LNHRAADSLHEAEQDQLKNILRKPAEQRANRHDAHAGAEHFMMAVNIAQAPADDPKPDARHLINDQRPGNAEHVRSQSRRQGRHRNHKYTG
jgi:hypothetical protein